jgi:hypothetical protein
MGVLCKTRRILREVLAVGQGHGLRLAGEGHAGDGAALHAHVPARDCLHVALRQLGVAVQAEFMKEQTLKTSFSLYYRRKVETGCFQGTGHNWIPNCTPPPRGC